MKSIKKLSRRDFLSVITLGIGGLIGLAMGIPAIPYLIGNAFKKNEKTWVRLGTVTKVELGTPTLFKAKMKRQSGWTVNEEDVFIYVLTDNGREFKALSNICTHLGCRVRWNDEKIAFLCPCHDGAFNQDGSVAYGPPPRPLDDYEVKVENDQLYIFGG